MKFTSKIAPFFAALALSLALLACSPIVADPEKSTAEAAKTEMTPTENSGPMPTTALPVQYQKPAYMVDSPSKDELDNQADDVTLKVGAKISSAKKMALRDIMKPLASQKRMNISWASDVNQEALVDVDIQPNDDFYKAIDNLLRQVDYFYELQGNTIIIKFRETRQFHIAMPFTKQDFSTGTGGNVLGGDVGGDGIAKNIEGTIKLVSEKNEFDTWKKIQENLESILKLERTKKITIEQSSTELDPKNPAEVPKNPANQYDNNTPKNVTTTEEVTGGSDNYYLIDKPVGLITVTASRPVQEKLTAYFTSLQKEMYKQISIEAKIIEVQLIDDSSIGINWDSVLKNFSVSGAVAFGAQIADLGNGVTNVGQVFPYIFSESTPDGKTHYSNGNTGPNYDPTRFVSNVRINTANFEVFLNALKTQGNTKVLSNPKISVLNGQPAMITVGQNVTYIDKIEVTVDATTGKETYTVKTARILSGVGMALTATILDNKEIILNLVPVTSELQGVIEYKQIGGGEVGLPIVNVREMSTTVRVNDGEMLVIGGLISDVNDDQENFAPVVGEIPIVKYLFGYEEKIKHKRELIVLLKPRII